MCGVYGCCVTHLAAAVRGSVTLVDEAAVPADRKPFATAAYRVPVEDDDTAGCGAVQLSGLGRRIAQTHVIRYVYASHAIHP